MPNDLDHDHLDFDHNFDFDFDSFDFDSDHFHDDTLMPPDTRDYRQYVGGNYSLSGLHQLNTLVAHGLRPTDRVLDIGCGSLRAGRFLIMFLEPHRYFGIEPNHWLLHDAITNEVSRELVRMKGPRFSPSREFVSNLGEQYDFVLAHSILSHTPVKMAAQLFTRIAAVLAPDGKALVTANITTRGDPAGDEWVYPGAVAFTWRTLARLAKEDGLDASLTGELNLTKQNWIKLERV